MANKPTGSGDAKGKKFPEEEFIEEPPKSPSEILREECAMRAMMRKARFKRRWPSITKVKINTIPWHPPPPPQKPPPIIIDLPAIETRRWVPPFLRRRRKRPKRLRIPIEEIQQPLPESHKLNKVWHNFKHVACNKMMLQGTIGCNSKKFSSTCGAQTGCIAVVCRALLEEKTPAQLIYHDVDDVIEAGDRYYRQCLISLKCYKGDPKLQLHQQLTHFFLHDTKYIIKMSEIDRGLLAKHPDQVDATPDLMSLMEKRAGSTYMMILSVGDNRHFLIWGHPPAPEAGSSAKTICYIFDPHMLNQIGLVDKLNGAGAFLRYAGVTSFVLDFLANYGNFAGSKKNAPKPTIALTNIEIFQKEHLIREPTYELDLKALSTHCKYVWQCMNTNALIEKKRYHGEYPLGSLSMVSLAASQAHSKKKVRDFYQKLPKEPLPVVPVLPEKAPPNPTVEQIMALKGEDFFLYAPNMEGHAYGRDDLIPLPKSETVLHSPVEVATHHFHSQFHQLDVGRWILRGTRHMASYRYQTFRTYTAIPCCVAALAMLHRHRARAWNEDTIDETLDAGYNLYRESLMPRRGPIRHLTIGEIIENFKIRDREFKHKERNIAYWGRIISSNPMVFDLCRGIEAFFRESDSGLLQIPGEFEVAIWNEGGKFYVYHPWPADRYGHRVGLQDGGKACLLYFNNPTRLCEHFLESVSDLKRKPYSISDIQVFERRKQLPEPVNNMKPVAPGRWIVRGSFHEGDARFPEEHRGRQATPCSLMALGLAHVVDPSQWTKEDIDETLTRGDVLYQSTIENLEKMGISLDSPPKSDEEREKSGDDEEIPEEDNSSGSLAAADVINRFNVTENDCIEADVMDSPFNGHLDPEPGSGFPSLKTVLNHFFKEYSHGIFTARGMSTAIWKQDGNFYFYDPHGCDENGLPSDEPRATACLVRIQGKVNELADVLVNNVPPGSDNSFNISPVTITATKLNPEIGAPETKLDSKAFEWIRKGTAAIMMGPRGENSAIGKAATKAGIDDDDKAGRKIALPAAAAFVAAASTIPPPHMHQDHMYNFLDVGSKYYLKHVKETGRTDMKVEDLTDKFEMGANTYTIELDEPTRLPLRQPDQVATEGEGGGEEKEEIGEGEEQPEVMKEMKDLLFKMWYDHTNPTTISLLLGDYHQLGLWMTAGGKVVAFDPAPTLYKGMLTTHRIEKGDELRLQRIKDEMDTEGGGEPEEGDEEAGEGEAQPEPEPTPVPPEACPALIVAASPGEFIDKLVAQGGLDKKQALGPYWLYKAKVTNELTASLKEKSQKKVVAEEGAEEEPVDDRIPELPDEVIGKYFERMKRSVASLRGRCSQGENYFMDNPNRNNQDAANCVMGIIVENIEPYTVWKPELLDAILKYGDRLYTLSLPNAKNPPRLQPGEIVKEFHVTNFNVRLEIEPDVVQGDIKAGETGAVLSLRRGIEKFLSENQYGVLCAKAYCVAIFSTGSVMLWEPHAVGPTGLTSPAGAASAIHFSTTDELADTYKANVENLDLDRPGNNRFTISAVKVFWEYSKSKGTVSPQGAVPDEGYEWKVLTAYVETARGRTILRGSRPADLTKFTRDALLQSSCGAVVAAAMSETRRPALWTRRTVDEIMNISGQLFATSLGSLGYEFRPGEDVLLPLQVQKRFVLGSNYVRFDLHEVFVGKLEQKENNGVTVRSALEHFFDRNTLGILWSVPYAVAVWRVAGAPTYYMMEPHACGPTGLRTDAQDEGAACVMTFTSPKLMAFAYLQNTPPPDRTRHSFQLYSMTISVQPIKKLGPDPPIVKQGIGPPGVTLVPATSKVTVEGAPRRASERDRKHPPSSPTCQDAQRASERADKEISQLKGQRNWSGWLVLYDGTQFLSACHSIACKKFSHASRGNQALACSVMSVAMSRVEDVCRWCTGTLDQILESGDQLYQDSYLHFRPATKILQIQQILRKFYTPGNCVCRVVVYRPRHTGSVNEDLVDKVTEFFREEKLGVLVASPGTFAVALFRTPRGYYMFDPADRDRYGRAVAPPCIGRARACFSQYPSVKSLCDKLGPNIPPEIQIDTGETAADNQPPASTSAEPQASTSTGPKPAESQKEVHFEQPASSFSIYGMDVTTLRRLNRHER